MIPWFVCLSSKPGAGTGRSGGNPIRGQRRRARGDRRHQRRGRERIREERRRRLAEQDVQRVPGEVRLQLPEVEVPARVKERFLAQVSPVQERSNVVPFQRRPALKRLAQAAPKTNHQPRPSLILSLRAAQRRVSWMNPRA